MKATCRSYHDATSYDRHAMGAHRLDWAGQPSVCKSYAGMTVLPLPRIGLAVRPSFQQVLAGPAPAPGLPTGLTVDRLSFVFGTAYGVTAVSRAAAGDFFYRSVPSAGALFPVELYVAVSDVAGLAQGLYHYDGQRFGLCRLRGEDVTAVAAKCLVPPVAAAATIFVTGIVFRSAWKYRKRALRYVLLDAGHVLENLMMSLRAAGFVAAVRHDVDAALAGRLLGYDPGREICLAAVCVLPRPVVAGDGATPDPAPLPSAVAAASQMSANEISYPEIRDMVHAAARLPGHPAAPAPMHAHLGIGPPSWHSLEASEAMPDADFASVVRRRRSRRNFVSSNLPEESFRALLQWVHRALQHGTAETPPFGSTVAAGLLVQHVPGVNAGFYLWDIAQHRWGGIQPGRLHAAMAAVCLDQQWLSHAAVHLLLLANLVRLDQAWGARGYPYAMVAAGRIAQVFYLAATALKLGCCGVGALFDGEAKSLLGLPTDTALLYLAAAGPVKNA